ncbi:MAG: aminoglycoside phosphotransferase family protein [Thermomicrobiales bacterium]
MKVQSSTGTRKVRQWPAAATHGDLAFGHEVISAARDSGLETVPAVLSLPDSNETVLRIGTRLFDAQDWLPGQPPPRAETFWPEANDRIDLPAALPVPLFAQVIAAIAIVHGSTTTLAAQPGVPAAPIAALPDIVRQAQARQLASLRARAPREPAIQRWLATGERLLAAAEPVIVDATATGALPVAAVHLDLWPSHVLRSEDSITGLLGWERAVAGSPLLDLSQAIVRLRGWSEEAVEAAIGAYSERVALPPAERRVLPAIAALDAVATTGQLLVQAYPAGVAERPPSLLRAAIDMMLRSLTELEHGLTIAAAKRPRRAPFRHGRQRQPAKGAPRRGR